MFTAMTLLLAQLAPLAHAGAWEAKTNRDPLPAREVERALVLGRGWLEIGLGTDVKVAHGYWGPNGEALDFEHARFLYTTQRLDLRYGVTRRSDIYLRVPVNTIQLTNDLLGTDTTGVYWGDPRFGWRYELYRVPEQTSIAGVLEMKAPAGNEAPGGYIAGPSTFREFVNTTGTPDLKLAVEARHRLGPVALTGELGGVYRFSNIVQYVIETERNQFLGRIKPGAQAYAQLEVLAQIGPAYVYAQPGVEVHRATAMGVSSDGVFPDQALEPVAGSDGWSADLDTGVTFNLTRHVDLNYNAKLPLRGEDLQFFPIEDIHPTRGVTHSGTVEFRF